VPDLESFARAFREAPAEISRSGITIQASPFRLLLVR
jgi:hypothetical protein